MTTIVNRVAKGSKLTIAEVDANFTNLNTDKIETSSRDGSGGVSGLTLFKLNLKNAANTFTNFLTNTTTAARTWTFPDKDGTIALIGDVLPNITNVFDSAFPNNIINAAGIQVVAPTPNAHLVLLPKGTGSLSSSVLWSAPGIYGINLGRDGNIDGSYAVNIGANNSCDINSASALNIGINNVNSGSETINIGSANTANIGAVNSLNVGFFNNVSGSQGFTFGQSNTADNSISIGTSNISSFYSSALGGTVHNVTNAATAVGGSYHINSGADSTSFGTNPSNSIAGKLVIGVLANSENLTLPSEQTGIYSASANTTTTAQKFTSTMNEPSTHTATNHLVIPDFSCVTFIGTITARKTSSAQTSGWKIEGLLSRGNGVGTTTLSHTITAIAGTTPLFGVPTLSADTTYGGLGISVPITTQLVSWVTQLMTSETTVAS
jgi:hypothetical protein